VSPKSWPTLIDTDGKATATVYSSYQSPREWQLATHTRGEHLGAYQASAVYRLLGRKGLEREASPPVGAAITNSDVGYHVRGRGHSVEIFDWLRFLEFAEYHLKK
jgi:hypothetical protein